MTVPMQDLLFRHYKDVTITDSLIGRATIIDLIETESNFRLLLDC